MTYEKDLNIIKQKLYEFKKGGFDRVHIPGGTSKDGSHYSGGIVFNYDHTTRIMYFLGVPYNSLFHKREEGEEEHSKKKDNETPTDTFLRELMEETGLQATPEDLEELQGSRLVLPGRPDPSKKHTKYFYLIKAHTGHLFDFEGANKIDKETAAPVMIPASIFVKVLFRNHHPALREAISKLMAMNRDYCDALLNVYP